MRKISVLLLSLLLANHVYASCDNDLDIQLAKNLKYNDALARGDSYFSACKVWPADPKKTIVALSFIQPDRSDEYSADEGDYDLNVLVVETGSNKILSRIYKRKAFISDAIALTNIGIDTARYDLADGVRAFGVTSSYTGASRVNPYGATRMTLYVEKGKQLKPILQNLVINSGNGEWDGNCKGEFSDINRIIDISKNTTSGYKDLIIRQSETKSRSSLDKKGECVEYKSPLSKKSHHLKFNGQAYTLPSVLENNW